MITLALIPLLTPLLVQGEGCFRYRFHASKGLENPCRGYVCPFNAWCVPSEDSTHPKCVCHQICYDVGDSDDSFPVCGSNGVNYKSLCHLKREACSLEMNVTVKYWGRCGKFSPFWSTNRYFTQTPVTRLTVQWVPSVVWMTKEFPVVAVVILSVILRKIDPSVPMMDERTQISA